MAKYSIWLDIPKPQKSEYQKIINQLTKKYKGTEFEPHITLLGDVSIQKKKLISNVKKIFKNEKPFKINLEGASFSTTYFQSVFLKVSASERLMSLNLKIKNNLKESNNLYIPHLSMLYGNQKIALRERISEQIRYKYKSFTITKIIIVPSTNQPKKWNHIIEIPLSGDD